MSDYSDEITLIQETITKDADGYPVSVQTENTVFADRKSATRSEFFSSMRAGVTETDTFELAAQEYSNEKLIRYNGRMYEVIRTFQNSPDMIQLNCREVTRQ